MDLARVGLDAPPKEPLFLGRARLSAPGLAGGDGSIVFPFYLVSLCSLLFANARCFHLPLGSSADMIIAWGSILILFIWR